MTARPKMIAQARDDRKGVSMLSEGAVRTARMASEIGHHLRAPSVVAAMGLNCAHQLRDAAPLVLLSISRVLPHASAEHCGVCEPEKPTMRVAIHQWDDGRWFVISEGLGMLGEIEQVG